MTNKIQEEIYEKKVKLKKEQDEIQVNTPKDTAKKRQYLSRKSKKRKDNQIIVNEVPERKIQITPCAVMIEVLDKKTPSSLILKTEEPPVKSPEHIETSDVTNTLEVNNQFLVCDSSQFEMMKCSNCNRMFCLREALIQHQQRCLKETR